MYKLACQINLRVPTIKGLIPIEQLKSLGKNRKETIKLLDELAVDLEEQFNNSGRKSFLTKQTKKNTELKLALDIVLDILGDLVAEEEKLANKEEDKKFNQKILAAMAKKKDEEFEDASYEELQNMLRK